LDEPAVRGQLGFLYDAYERDFWYFEMIDMGHKLILTSLLAFVPGAWQMTAGLLVVLSYLAIVLLFRPYFRKSDDRLFVAGQGELVLIMMGANVFYWTGERDSTLEAVMAVIFVGLFLTFFALFLSQAVQAGVKIRNKRLRLLRARSMSTLAHIELNGKDVGQVDRQDIRVRHHKEIKGEDGISERVRNPLWNVGDAEPSKDISTSTLAPGKKSSSDSPSGSHSDGGNPMYTTTEDAEDVEGRPARDSMYVRRDSAFDRVEADDD
jgi:hypothetical protein